MKYYFPYIFLILLFNSCKKDEIIKQETVNPNEKIINDTVNIWSHPPYTPQKYNLDLTEDAIADIQFDFTQKNSAYVNYDDYHIRLLNQEIMVCEKVEIDTICKYISGQTTTFSNCNDVDHLDHVDTSMIAHTFLESGLSNQEFNFILDSDVLVYNHDVSVYFPPNSTIQYNLTYGDFGKPTLGTAQGVIVFKLANGEKKGVLIELISPNLIIRKIIDIK